MAYPFHKTIDVVAANLTAQGVESFLKPRQQNVLVRVFGFGTDSLEAVVGQRQMGQATKMQMSFNPLPLLHLILAEPQRSLQFLEQHFNHPTSFVDGHDVTCLQAARIGDDGHQILPRIAWPFAQHNANPADLLEQAVRERNGRPTPTARPTHADPLSMMLEQAWAEVADRSPATVLQQQAIARRYGKPGK